MKLKIRFSSLLHQSHGEVSTCQTCLHFLLSTSKTLNVGTELAWDQRNISACLSFIELSCVPVCICIHHTKWSQGEGVRVRGGEKLGRFDETCSLWLDIGSFFVFQWYPEELNAAAMESHTTFQDSLNLFMLDIGLLFLYCRKAVSTQRCTVSRRVIRTKRTAKFVLEVVVVGKCFVWHLSYR